jgi:DNA-binding NarL/FixJ family response regulator
MYNIAVIEDNLAIRKEISDYFAASEKIDCVMAVDTVEKFLKYHRDFLEIKLVLLDVMLYNQSSIYSIPHILQREPEVEIIMFTVDDTISTLFQSITYGATGYLLKSISMQALEQSLLTVLNGEGALLSPGIAKKIIGHFKPESRTVAVGDIQLGEKEAVVMNMLREGYKYEHIAERLGITVNGVRYYVKSVYKKLNVGSKGELLRININTDPNTDLT